jgi:osmotically-inducible protein OsmY
VKLTGLSIMMLACLLLTTATSFAAAEAVKDKDIDHAIETEFWASDAVDGNDVSATTQDGIVTLAGTVEHLLAKEHARKIAEATVGVRAVINQIKVVPETARTDAELQDAVEQALFKDPATDSYEVTVSADNGIVSLSGTVDSWQEKQLCSTVAKAVKGVRDINNNIVIDFALNRPDQEIKPEIEARLANDILIDDYLVNVDVNTGTVQLSGTVGSVAEKRRAVSDAWVGGVKDVNADDLEVQWWARDKLRRKSSYVARTDEEIKEAVKDAFLFDPRVFSFDPQVEVDAGTVTLTGVVDNMEAKRAAEKDARNTLGVWRVKNHLKVRPGKDTEADALEKRAADALLENPYVSRLDVKVEAYQDGWITLSGRVNNSFEKDMAEQVVSGVKGVTGILNNLDYDYEWSWKPDWVLREDIKDELYWSPFVDEEQVSITVDRGVVTLTGNVETWTERLEAGKNAWEAGAKDVRNRLTVTYRFYGPYPYYWQFGTPYGDVDVLRYWGSAD